MWLIDWLLNSGHRLAMMGGTVASLSDRLKHSRIPQPPTQDGKVRKHVLMSLCTLTAGAVTFAVVYCQSLGALVALMYFQGLSLGMCVYDVLWM